MRASGLRLAVGLALALTALILPSASSAATTIGNYLVVLKDSTSDPGAVASDEGSRYGFSPRMIYRTAVKGYAASMSDAAAAALAKSDRRVEFVSVDREFTAIGGSTSQTLPTGSNRIEADLSSAVAGNGIGSVSVPIAVIDSGSTHPDLNVVGGKGCVPNSTSYTDGNGHGTHVAGTTAARDNGIGVVGVAPGAPVWSVRVLGNNGSGTTASLVCGVDWVTANAAATGIKVANMSIAGPGSDDGNCGRTNGDALHLAICNSVARGVTYVVGAGNTGTNLASTIPAAYDEVLTVTGMADFNGQPGGGAASTCQKEVDDTSYDYSNFATPGGADVAHTIAAPATCIYSTYKNGGYATMSGTSMATAHVSGAVASCIASGPCAGLSPAGIIGRLRSDAAARPAGYGFTGDPNSPNGTRYFGYLVYTGGY